MTEWINKTRTWSREVAFLMFLGLGWLAYEGRTEELEILVWPVTIFALPSFGFKQPAVENWMKK